MFSRLLKLSLFLTIGFGAISCGSLSNRIVSDPEPSASRLRSGADLKSEIDQLALPLVDSGEIRGIAVGIITPDGNSHFYGYGKTRDDEKASAPTEETIFQLGSVSKVFVASLYSILLKEGSIQPNDTIRSILPANIPLSADAGKITLYELATHSSGLPREPQQFKQFYYLMKYRFTGKNLYSYINEKFLYDYLGKWKKSSSRNPKYEYSNIGYGLLAHLLEIKMNRSLPDLMAEKIFKPLNIKNTAFNLNDEQKKLLAVGHAGDDPLFMRRGTPIKPWDMGTILRGTGALYSSTGDLLVFAKSNLGFQSGTLTPMLASTRKPQLKFHESDIGLGWTEETLGKNKIKVSYIHGMASGYTGYLGIDDDAKIAVVVLCNSFNWDDKIGHNLVLRLVSGLAR